MSKSIKPDRKPILLIDPGIGHARFVHERAVNRGLLSIASFLSYHGYPVDLISLDQLHLQGIDDEQQTFDWLTGLLAKKDYFLAAVSSLFVAEFSRVERMLFRIKKERPDIVTIVGGHYPTFHHEEILEQCKAVDFVGRCEGEWLVRNLVDYLLSGKQDVDLLRGFTYRRNGKVVVAPDLPLGILDDLPPLDYTLLDSAYLKHEEPPNISIEFNRGCPFNCSFCSATRFWRHSMRKHNKRKILVELRQLCDLGYAGKVSFEDETIDLRSQELKDFLKELKRESRRRYTFDYLVTRYDTLDQEGLRQLHELGLRDILIGLESGSRKILESINKKIDLEDFPKSCRLIKESCLRVNVFIIVGLPGESEETFRETYAYLENLINEGLISNILVSYFQPYQATDSFQKMQEYGGRIVEADKQKWILRGGPLVEYPNLSSKRQLEMFKDISVLNERSTSRFYTRF